MTSRGIGAILALTAISALGVRAQQPAFRATTELVVVDVSVVGKDGAPVRGLQESDFAVTVDGKPRRVRTLQFVDQSAGAPGETRSLRPVSSNAPGDRGRLVLILVDEGSIGFGVLPSAAQSIEHLLAGFGPADKIGVATLPGPRMRVDFTRDRAAVAAAVQQIAGGAGTTVQIQRVNVAVGEAFAIDRGDPDVIEQVVTRECPPSDPLTQRVCAQSVGMQAHAITRNEQNRTSEFTAGLRSLLQHLATVDAPKVVVVLSQGFPDPGAPAEMMNAARFASAARAAIFALRLDRSMFDLSSRSSAAFMMTSADERSWAKNSLDALTAAARGDTFDIIGSADLPFARLARELSGYYLVGVEAAPSDHDGRFHPIKVEVNRPGVTVRARREVAARPRARGERELLERALASPLTVSDVPLRVSTFNLADDDPAKVRVLVVAEVDRHQASDGDALVGLLFSDAQGKAAGDPGRRMELPRAESGALMLIATSSLPPGAYTLKLAVARDGRAGSVEHAFEARVTQPAASGSGATALQLGEVLVMTPASNQKAVPGLDVQVLGDRIVSLVPLGLAPPHDRFSFVFDIAKDEAGAALVSAAATVDEKPKGRARFAEATLDARLLPPGEYGVRLNVLASGAPVASLYTPFRLERQRGAAAAAERAATSSPARAARFVRGDVLDPMVLGPFLEEVARLSPASSRAAIDLARSGRIEEGAQLLAPGDPGDPAPPFLRGLALFERGALQEASNEFRAAIAEAPELLVGAFYLGACYAAGGKDQQAVGAWQTSLTALGRYPAVYRFLGDALMRSGQADRARPLLADAAARWPGEEAFRPRVVAAAANAGDFQEALDYADRLIEDEPGDSSMLFLAMRSSFQALLEGADVDRRLLLERLERYRGMYASAGGLQQPLVEEWVTFARGKQ